ncbi:HAD hydrolase-like protein [Primorskyibacter sp. S187A]|uniref:HAD hydrolase-like protein n=1 Tax=Primorskyibacter sp. S187A TaxID=3415130 RepID=UPI003C7AA9B2
MRSVIFDLDGTLADTSGDLLAAANACFRQMGHGDVLGPPDAGIALRGGKMMLRTGLARLGRSDEAEVERWYQPLLEAYGAALDQHTFLYDGAMEAVETLKSHGFAVGICTNKPEGLAEALMTSLGARGAFGALIGADTLPVRKPDPAPLVETVRRLNGDPKRTCLVGDSDTDRNTAAAAGVPSILVTFGPSGEDMAALAPEGLLHDYSDLPALAAQLVP